MTIPPDDRVVKEKAKIVAYFLSGFGGGGEMYPFLGAYDDGVAEDEDEEGRREIRRVNRRFRRLRRRQERVRAIDIVGELYSRLRYCRPGTERRAEAELERRDPRRPRGS